MSKNPLYKNTAFVLMAYKNADSVTNNGKDTKGVG